jgi:hypothetical protein
MFEDDALLLEGAPRLFAIVADPHDDDHPEVIAWGHASRSDMAVGGWPFGGCGVCLG